MTQRQLALIGLLTILAFGTVLGVFTVSAGPSTRLVPTFAPIALPSARR